ncbi:heme-binding protein [Sphingorhabdus sp. EL138]|uniref:heme-binding protein n=1 Tax=Sphingorhabdus sp. EL138 TaxID=2073156 RepID=UPI0025F4F1BD|nr:heme-binding protein [Sphingorhabdus sp. EL138]
MRKQLTAIITSCSLILSSCGGGSSSGANGGDNGAQTPSPSPPAGTARLYSDPSAESLTVTDVERVISLAVAEAQARNLPSTIAVVDRVGNVLGVFVMNGANLSLRIPDAPGGPSSNTDLQGINLPAPAAVAGAISKAITGAYLSSSGNAFSTRTASQIVQQHFPPAPTTVGLESGPLYGVQFSQLPCSDLMQRFGSFGARALIGPKRSPLGLSADSGGFPLYKNGVVVGGIGVMGDGLYGFDPNILDVDNDTEEFIAFAATQGFAPNEDIKAERISVDGTLLRYSDATVAGLRGGAVQSFTALNGRVGNLINVPGYSDGSIVAGSVFGSEASGVRAATAAEFANRDAYILSDGSGTNRFPIRAGTDAASVATPLSTDEARSLLEESFAVMSRSRGQIRRPSDSRAQMTISLVDTHGAVLGIVRGPDAPVFGTDVSLQKARTAAFFSNPRAASDLAATNSPSVGMFLASARTFFGSSNIFTGQHAWTTRAISNISRPYFPDGEVGRAPGPFSRDINGFNPFSTGLQSALIVGNVTAHVGFLLGGNPDTPARCTTMPDVATGQNRLQNGIQIFPGSVPVYRGSTLVGAIGVSGDGIDQDDMAGFLGANTTGLRIGGIGNAPPAMRTDQIEVTTSGAKIRLRYIGCPFAPFLGSNLQNVCQGL